MTLSAAHPRRAHVLVALTAILLAVLVPGQMVFAHTDFDSSSPADGEVVTGPLTEVVVNVTNPAQPAGFGFELLDPAGAIRTPASIDETDGTSFVLTFDPPLGAGVYGLRWSVRAGDAHPIEGSFQFEVTVTPTTAAASDAPATTVVPVAAETPSAGSADGENVSLDDFLSAASTGDSPAAGRVGRMVSMLGAIFGVGVLAALIWTIRGNRDELMSHLTWVRLAGLVVFAGGLIEFAALTETGPSASFGTLLSTKAGLATALKMAGGVAVLIGFRPQAGRTAAPARSVSAASVADPSFAPAIDESRTDSPAAPDEHRWSPTPAVGLGLLGYALVVASFWFDGHTVSRGPWAIHSLVNLVHLVAAAVWVGGVFAMTLTAWMRRRRPEGLGLAAMVVRFSSIATVTLVAVILAGSAMAWMVLDTPGDVFRTDWGRVLLAKTACVAVAAALGAFNHFRLRPALRERPDDPKLAAELRVSLSVESVVLVAVIVLTAILVASAT